MADEEVRGSVADAMSALLVDLGHSIARLHPSGYMRPTRSAPTGQSAITIGQPPAPKSHRRLDPLRDDPHDAYRTGGTRGLQSVLPYHPQHAHATRLGLPRPPLRRVHVDEENRATASSSLDAGHRPKSAFHYGDVLRRSSSLSEIPPSNHRQNLSGSEPRQQLKSAQAITRPHDASTRQTSAALPRARSASNLQSNSSSRVQLTSTPLLMSLR